MVFAGVVPGAMGEMGGVVIRVDWERWESEPVGGTASAPTGGGGMRSPRYVSERLQKARPG